MDINLAQVSGANQAIMGVNWTRFAQLVEHQYPFAQFDFDHPPIRMFKEPAPECGGRWFTFFQGDQLINSEDRDNVRVV
ncbi:hypothetical protein [Ensifer sp. ENS03]|uniref:hypothetical protein n=1 Tax=Ensifer sp. ENS03 TaxID=2769283 RepID=UPI00178718CB|nr:hypothetical protein [Ensifer sp. ENS03]MBD9560658.1 hypothetical protein [Ensifer sp. ENS03]